MLQKGKQLSSIKEASLEGVREKTERSWPNKHSKYSTLSTKSLKMSLQVDYSCISANTLDA